MSKIFERYIFRQLHSFMLDFLSKYQCGFRKGYSTQPCLLAMLETWKSAVDKGKSFAALLTDLSKAFDCLSHKLLFAKLHAYGFSIAALKLIHSYLTNSKQRTTRIHSRTFTVQHLPLGPVLHNERKLVLQVMKMIIRHMEQHIL